MCVNTFLLVFSQETTYFVRLFYYYTLAFLFNNRVVRYLNLNMLYLKNI